VSTRDDDRRLADVQAAIHAMERHLTRATIDDEVVFDACRARLVEIGESVKVKGIDAELLTRALHVPWREIARMRDHLTHRDFDTQHQIVADVITTELPRSSAQSTCSAFTSLTPRQAGVLGAGDSFAAHAIVRAWTRRCWSRLQRAGYSANRMAAVRARSRMSCVPIRRQAR
jgi:uncharacterized protein with HEPN domain